MDRSPWVGLANPVAPPLRLSPDLDTRLVHGTVTFGNAYEGALGCMHGGHVAAVFDEALGMACIFAGVPDMTGEITISNRKPTPIHVPLRVEARSEKMEGRNIYTSGELHPEDVLLAKSTGLFISIKREKFLELPEEQIRPESSSAARVGSSG